MEGLTLLFLYLAIPSLLYSAVKQYLTWRKNVGSKPRFPGPQQLPIVGHVHDLSRFSLWLKFKEWADEHGPIYYTKVLDQRLIIVSDEKIAEELLVKRGHIYSGRPQIRSLIRHKEGPAYSALMDRHDIWKAQRRWCHAAMAEAYKHHFYGHVEKEMSRYLGLLLLDPARFLDYTREYCGRVMSRLAWDDATQGRATGDSADQTLHCMSLPGPVTNLLTPLWHLPALVNPWYTAEVRREREQRAWWLASFRLAKDRMRRGDLPGDTWAYRYFEQLRREGNEGLDQPDDDEVFASCMLGFLNLVGVVTISGPLKFFLMAMALHPEWQKKAQGEIDRVCGNRMPTMQDYAQLPTVRACLKETLRWRSNVPLGVPHQAEADDEYRGVKIKKGTVILACEWNLNRVPTRYPDGNNYRPERFLEPGWPTYQEPLTRYPNFREGVSMHSFGWGRRTCLGQNLADDETFVFAAATLWAFRLAPETCPRTGRVVPIDSQATNSHVILEPLPYRMSIKVRGAERGRLVLEGYREVMGELRV
ncbi:cytochrome P450 [Parathielavia hyrcaniae]|uniref:Cytochrome P450 n=1 Tax=Parathielavia hyrcaniae TaxID=113614 RepID=A0AAN6T153_9PEZI|nr:cytochrome P450 [Parathielavia hyrcaniae]